VRIALVAILTVGMMIPGTAPAVAAPYAEPLYVGQIGHPGHSGVYAWGMATAANGNLLVGDYWNYRVHEYTVDGTLMNTFGARGDADGENNAPHGIAVNPNNGNIYVSDLNNGEIDLHSADGTFIDDLRTWEFHPTTFEYLTTPIPYAPRVAIDSNGWSYMVNSHTFPSPEEFLHRIIIRDEDWNYLGHIGEWGEFGVLRGVAVGPGDQVYVVDAGQGLVHRFERDIAASGVVYNQLESFGSGMFGGDVRGITVDFDNGWVYVVDAGSSQVEKFDLIGNSLLTWGSEGTGPGQFRDGGREVALAADPRAGFELAPPLIAVADFGNNRVNVYDSSGAFLWDFPSPPLPPADDGFNQIQDVAVSTDGSFLYTADTFNHRTQKFDTATGDLVTTWGFRGSSDPYAMNYPRGVAVDPDNGDVWVNNTREGDIKVYDANGVFKFAFAGWGSGPLENNYSRGIEVESGVDGRVFIADGINRRIHITDKQGNLITNVSCGVDSSGTTLAGCTDVVPGPDGTFFAASVKESVVYQYSPGGEVINTLGGSGILQGPYGLATHDGRLFVSEAWSNQISVFDFNGSFVDSFGGPGTGDGEFDQPKGIDISHGMLYVADHHNERIQVFDLTAGPAIDTTAPETTVTFPAHRSTLPAGVVNMSGQGSDDVGVDVVRVGVRDVSTGLWLQSDGSSWGTWHLHDATVLTPGSAAIDWTFSVTLAEGSYGFTARGFDAAGNEGRAPWTRFEVAPAGEPPDAEDPVTSVSAPEHRSTIPAGAITISGDATDNIGVDVVQVAIRDASTGLWLQSDGGSWGGWYLHDATVVGQGSTSATWSIDVNLSAGSYGFTARGKDAAGNTGKAPWTAFTAT
jgi:DNA-binding beta-propeller fold protein YncE